MKTWNQAGWFTSFPERRRLGRTAATGVVPETPPHSLPARITWYTSTANPTGMPTPSSTPSRTPKIRCHAVDPGGKCFAFCADLTENIFFQFLRVGARHSDQWVVGGEDFLCLFIRDIGDRARYHSVHCHFRTKVAVQQLRSTWCLTGEECICPISASTPRSASDCAGGCVRQLLGFGRSSLAGNRRCGRESPLAYVGVPQHFPARPASTPFEYRHHEATTTHIDTIPPVLQFNCPFRRLQRNCWCE